MAKRGRPRKNGIQPLWMFGRSLHAIRAYNSARIAGQKHSCAVSEAVEAVKKIWPGRPISATEVKRILAQYQPKGARFALKVVSGSDLPQPLTPEMAELLGKRKNRIVFGFGRKPSHARINAKS